MTQTDTSDYPGTIDVVCDHCSSGYHVSIMHFADNFKHQFHCPSCEQTWDEYLDINVWEEVRGTAQQMIRQEKEREKLAFEEEMRQVQAKQAEAEAEIQAIRAAQKQAEEKEAQEETTTEEPIAEEGKTEAAPQAKEVSAPKEEPSVRPETDSTAKPETEKPKKTKKSKKSKDTETLGPKSFRQKILTLLNPMRWGNFSITSLIFGIASLILIYVSSAGYFYINRADIVEENPLAAGTYHAVGIQSSPDDGLDVRIIDIERKDIKIPGERTQYEFNIRTKVRNFSLEERRLPYLRFSVMNLEGERVQFWDVDLSSRVLASSEEMNVATVIPTDLIGDEQVDSFVARLISRAEREYLGLGEIVENIAATL